MRPVYLAGILTGIASTMLGPLLPGFQARWGLDDAQSGLLFTAQFIAIVAASATVGQVVKRVGYRGAIAGGMALAAVGIAGAASASFVVAVVSVAVLGAGLGVAVPASNLATASAADDGGSARRVLYLNVFWSAGAMVASPLVATLRGWFLPSVAAAFVAMAAVVAVAVKSRPRDEGRTAVSRGGLPHALFGLMLFVYVGAESSIAGWAPSYAQRSATARELWAVLPAVFWGSILLGRIIAPNVLHRMRPSTMAPWGLAVALVGSMVLIASDGRVALLAGCAISGLGLSPIYPVTVAAYADRVGASVSGLVFSAAGLGGAVIPPLVGVVSTATGSLRLALAAVVALMAWMIWLQGRLKRA